MPRGAHRKVGAAGLPGAGPKPKYTVLKVPIASGKIPIAISVESAARLQQLMLRPVAGVETPEQMVEYLILKARGA